MSYQPVIGLEIHVQLKTKSKMFCGCPNAFGLENKPNIHICPVCTGQPGSLPVANQEAIKKVIKTGLALNCQIADVSHFDRKNYFYPDLPKGYQISQYDQPFCVKGYLEISDAAAEKKKITIRRIHLEEDTGKLVHSEEGGESYSLVDFNRAGVPLMELVTEPDLRSGVDAKKFCQELQLILRYLDVSDADMEKGQMRCEVNISLGELKTDKKIEENLGTKVEIKNLNSFRVVERAVDYEIKRQEELLKSGQSVIQETRGWSDEKQKTFSQRLKEEAHDYRYFPEPDLLSLCDLAALGQQLAGGTPELPSHKRQRFTRDYKLPATDIEVFIDNKALADYFEGAVSDLEEWQRDAKEGSRLKGEALVAGAKFNRDGLIRSAANYLINELPRLAEEARLVDFSENLREKITQENFAEFVFLVAGGALSRPAAQTVLKEMLKTGVDPSHIIGEMDLGQTSDESEIKKIVENVIKNNSKVVDDYRGGKENALQFLVGQALKESRGKANPQTVQQILKNKIQI